MTEQNDGGQAFPHATVWHTRTEQESGMSLRDYFAGQALAGLLQAGQGHCTTIEHDAYRLADAMIEARKETT